MAVAIRAAVIRNIDCNYKVSGVAIKNHDRVLLLAMVVMMKRRALKTR
jgi:hypothetical protein